MMRSLIHLLAVGGMLSLTLANNTTSHNQLLSRQTADCFPIFLEYPSDSFVPCGNLYISNLCTCCLGDALGCYTSLNICSVDSYGDSICCPEDNPNCAIEAVSPATSAPPSSPATTQVYESPPSTTTQDFSSAVVTTAFPTAPMTTQYYSSSTASASQSDTNTDFDPSGGQTTGTTTSAPSTPTSFLTGDSGGQSSNLCGRWEILAMLFVFYFIWG
jgi:hypothetical protein